VVCAVLRLARFNVETEEDDSHQFFSGLPSPAAAGAVASFMIAYPLLAELAAELPADAGLWDRMTHTGAAWLEPAMRFLLPLVTLACACLMVSRVRYSHFFNRFFRGRKSYQHLLMVLLGTFVAIMVREMAVPLIFCGFAFAAPLRALYDQLRGRNGATPAPPAGSQAPATVPLDDQRATGGA
jgi:CDP-diacylglycerol--serine O-phosphatidyltransferase